MSTQAQSIVVNKQQCRVTSLYRVWFGYGAGIIIFATLRNWILLVVWALAAPLAKWLQIRFYPYLSKFFGYGEVEDRAASSVGRTSDTVTFYHALGCPFCPIVSSRLKALQSEIGFTLNAVDVTLHPQLLTSRGIHSVPVVEVGHRRLVGNPTSKQLAELIAPAETAGRAC